MQIPKNVVQTGKVDACHKIYIEDYVHTFLKQYQKQEADFCLYGACRTEGSISYYFLYGAVKEEPGWEMMENRYFSGLQRIGEATFDEKDAWLFFEDGYSAAMDGYFIFYEQNEDMQSYLIAMHQNQPGEKPVEVRPRNSHSDHDGKALHQANQAPRRIHRKPLAYDLPSDRPHPSPVQSGAAEEKQTDSAASPSLRTGRGMREKMLHAAQTGERQRRPAHAGGRRIVHTEGRRTLRTGEEPGNHRAVQGGRANIPSVFPAGRGTVTALLVILCAVAVVSLSRPEEMREAGNFFAEAARELDEGIDGDAAVEAGSFGDGLGQGDGRQSTELLVEERQLSDNDLSTDTAVQPEMAAQTESETLFPIFTADLGMAESIPAETAASPVPTEEAETETPASSSDPAEEQTAAGVQEDEAVSAQPASSYVIQNGDNLAAICRRRYGSTERMEEIASLNGLSDPNHLIPGQEILLPQ